MENVQENKMGVMPVNKLLITMSLPMMISMLVQALYNIVDSVFVSRICENALTAVSLAFPLQTLMIGVSIGTCIGVNAILSKALGAKEQDRANQAALNGIFLAFLSYVVFFILGLTIVKPFYVSITDDPEIVKYGIDYMSVVMTLSFGIFFQTMFERLLTSTGRTMLTMITQSTGAVINIVLDPIFIFGLLGAPKMGVRGAAVATVIGQICAAIFALIFNLTKNKEIQLSFKGFRPDFSMIKDIYIIAVPSIIMQCIGSLMNYAMNKILVSFSTTAVAVFGVYYKLQSFIFMPIFGMNGGVVPIIAYNYGAGKRERLLKTWKLAWLYSTIIMAIGTILFEVIPGPLLKFFDASEYMLKIGIPALRIIGVHFPVAAYCIITGTLFQSLGKSVYSMVTSIMRQIVVLLPAAYLLSLAGNVSFVWWAFPIAEVMSAMATTFYLFRIKRKIISKLAE